jgi:hypothetical protein
LSFAESQVGSAQDLGELEPLALEVDAGEQSSAAENELDEYAAHRPDVHYKIGGNGRFLGETEGENYFYLRAIFFLVLPIFLGGLQ